MRKADRDIQVFSLSALDVLAMATGAFVVLMTLLMPYYRKTQDAEAVTAEVRIAAAVEMAQVAKIEAGMTEDSAAALRILAEAEQAVARGDALARRIAEAEAAIAAAKTRGAALRAEQESEPVADTSVIDALDIVFVMDTTHSMRPALADLSQSLSGIVRVLERLLPSLRIGFVAYTDRDTGYPPIRALPITDTDASLNHVLSFVRGLRPPPRGSATIEEDVHLGIQRALAMNWRPRAKQVIVVIGDAQAHPRYRRQVFQRIARFVAGGDNRAVSALFVSTPTSRSRGDLDRRFFADVAEAGHGTFTEHSGGMFEAVILSVLTPPNP